MDKVVESVAKFIEDNTTEDNYDISDYGATIWAEAIVGFLREQGYIRD